MQVKDGVEIQGIQPELVFGLNEADKIYKALGKELVITAIVDGKHSSGSLHYVGYAADLRTRYFPDNGEEATRRLRESLGRQWDIVVEANHIHMEFQPKS